MCKSHLLSYTCTHTSLVRLSTCRATRRKANGSSFCWGHWPYITIRCSHPCGRCKLESFEASWAVRLQEAHAGVVMARKDSVALSQEEGVWGSNWETSAGSSMCTSEEGGGWETSTPDAKEDLDDELAQLTTALQNLETEYAKASWAATKLYPRLTPIKKRGRRLKYRHQLPAPLSPLHNELTPKDIPDSTSSSSSSSFARKSFNFDSTDTADVDDPCQWYGQWTLTDSIDTNYVVPPTSWDDAEEMTNLSRAYSFTNFNLLPDLPAVEEDVNCNDEDGWAGEGEELGSDGVNCARGGEEKLGPDKAKDARGKANKLGPDGEQGAAGVGDRNEKDEKAEKEERETNRSEFMAYTTDAESQSAETLTRNVRKPQDAHSEHKAGKHDWFDSSGELPLMGHVYADERVTYLLAPRLKA